MVSKKAVIHELCSKRVLTIGKQDKVHICYCSIIMDVVGAH